MHLGVAVPLGALVLDAARVPRDAVWAAAAAAAAVSFLHLPIVSEFKMLQLAPCQTTEQVAHITSNATAHHHGNSKNATATHFTVCALRGQVAGDGGGGDAAFSGSGGGGLHVGTMRSSSGRRT